MRAAYFLTLLVFSCIASFPAKAQDTDNDGDIGLWTRVAFTPWSKDKLAFAAAAEWRFRDDAQQIEAQIYGLKASYKATDFLAGAFGYTYLDVQVRDPVPFNEQHRLELELNPNFPIPIISERLTFRMRNRLEIRWLESRDFETTYRFRPRIGFRYETPGVPFLKFIEVSNEFFYDFFLDRYSENRFIPFSTSYDLGEHVEATPFFLIRSRRFGRSTDWETSYVIGVSFRLKPGWSRVFGGDIN